MSFKFNLAFFKSDKPDSKIDFSGAMKIKPEELDVFCRFVKSQTPDQYGNVTVPVSGWKKTSSKGTPYVSAVAQPPMGWVDPGDAPKDAAEQLAEAFNGSVVDVDLF